MPHSHDAPDGLGRQHVERNSRAFHRHASLTSLLLLGAVLCWALTGAAGGRVAWSETESAGTSLRVALPSTVRNGATFEAIVHFRADRPIAQLAIGLAPSLIRNTTVNSTVPTAESEDYHQGQFRFSFGPLPAGEAFEWKLALQLNPALVGTNAGALQVFDGDTAIARLPLHMEILP